MDASTQDRYQTFGRIGTPAVLAHTRREVNLDLQPVSLSEVAVPLAQVFVREGGDQFCGSTSISRPPWATINRGSMP